MNMIFMAGVMLAAAAATAPAVAQQQQRQQQPAAPGTVAWFLQNRDALKATMERCENDPGRLRNTPDCINAAAARERAFFSSPPPPMTGHPRY